MSITLIDKTADVIRALQIQCSGGLNEIGAKAVRHAQKEIGSAGRVDTGELQGSIRYEVRNDGVYVGTNNDHAAFHELGTGKFTNPHKNEKYGVSGIHFLHHAASRHTAQYKKILKEAMEK